MRSLSFSLLAVGLGSIGGLRPIGRPPSSFLSLSVQPSILIALLLGWNIIGDRRDGRPALQLLLASFDVEESAAQEAGRGSGYPPPPLYGRNARYPRYFRVEKLHLAALSLSLSSVSYRLEDTFFHPLMHLYICVCVYIYARLHWDTSRKNDKFILAKKSVCPARCRGTSIRVTSLMVSRIFQCLGSTDELEILF